MQVRIAKRRAGGRASSLFAPNDEAYCSLADRTSSRTAIDTPSRDCAGNGVNASRARIHSPVPCGRPGGARRCSTGYSRAGIACTAQPLPSGSLKKRNEPHGNSWTSPTSTPRASKLRTRGVNVRDHELQALNGARLHVAEPGADGDRAARPGRRQLHEADLVVDLVVVIGVEAGLLGVEGLRAIHVRDGNLHQFESPVHDGRQPIASRSGAYPDRQRTPLAAGVDRREPDQVRAAADQPSRSKARAQEVGASLRDRRRRGRPHPRRAASCEGGSREQRQGASRAKRCHARLEPGGATDPEADRDSCRRSTPRDDCRRCADNTERRRSDRRR